MAGTRVTVVLPVYNGADLVARAVESVLAQDYEDCELIVVDDGSTDASGDVAEGLGARVVRQENRGLAAARNTGIRNAHPDSQYAAFIDHDDVWLPGKLAAQVKVLDGNPDVGLCYTGVRFAHATDPSRSRLSEPLLDPQRPAVDHIFPVNWVAPSSVMLRRSALKMSGLFNEALPHTEDWDLWWQLAAHCRFRAVPDVLCEYTVHDSNRSRDMVSVVLGEITILEKRLPPLLPCILDTVPPDRRDALIRGLRRRLACDYSDVAKDHARKGRLRESLRYHLAAIRCSPGTGKLYPRLLRAGIEGLMPAKADR